MVECDLFSKSGQGLSLRELVGSRRRIVLNRPLVRSESMAQ